MYCDEVLDAVEAIAANDLTDAGRPHRGASGVVPIGTAVLAVVAGVWMLLNRSGLAVVSNDVVDLLGTSLVAVARCVGPAIPLYAGATALLLSARGISWWAEREANF